MNLLRRTLFILGLNIFAAGLLVNPALAEVGAPPAIVITPVVGFSSLGQAINSILGIIFLIGGMLTFFYLLYGAMKYITAGEATANVTAARLMMQNAIIGILLLGTIYIMFKVVVNIIPGLGSFFS